MVGPNTLRLDASLHRRVEVDTRDQGREGG